MNGDFYEFQMIFDGESFEGFTLTDDPQTLGIQTAVFFDSHTLHVTFENHDTAHQALELDHRQDSGEIEVYRAHTRTDTLLRHGVTHVAVERDTEERRDKIYICNSHAKKIVIFTRESAPRPAETDS